MDYIASPNSSRDYTVVSNNDPKSKVAFYRMRYPEEQQGYKTTLNLHKFDKDYDKVDAGGKNNSSKVSRTGSRNSILYNFINAFPISINSMPVSYNASETLKCSVNFVYDRYFVDRGTNPIQHQSLAQNFIGEEGQLNLPSQNIG